MLGCKPSTLALRFNSMPPELLRRTPRCNPELDTLRFVGKLSFNFLFKHKYLLIYVLTLMSSYISIIIHEVIEFPYLACFHRLQRTVPLD